MASAPDISGISEGIKQSIESSIQQQDDKAFQKVKAVIGISISDSPDLDVLGYSQLHVQDALVETARYLLINDCKLVFGGDLRKGGYTFIFSELARQYCDSASFEDYRIVNYFAWPIHLSMNRLNDSEFKANNIGIVKIPPPPGVDVDPAVFIKSDSSTNRLIWARSLSFMRQSLIKDTQARVLMGGQLAGYLGFIPGVVEEALLTLKAGQPLYICGAFGGATGAIVAAVEGNKPRSLSTESLMWQESYRSYLDEQSTYKGIQIDFTTINDQFSELGVEGLGKLNGLTVEENRRLFRTPHITEIVFLVIKGLKKNGLLQ